MKFKHISLALIAMMGLFFACNDDEETTHNNQADNQAIAQLSEIDSLMIIADVSNMNNIEYYMSQQELNGLLEAVTEYPTVDNSHIVYVSSDDYYAIRFDAETVAGSGINASSIMPLEDFDDGSGNVVNLAKTVHIFTCEEDGCSFCAPDGPTRGCTSSLQFFL